MMNLSVYPRRFLRSIERAYYDGERDLYWCPTCGRFLRNDEERHYAVGKALCEGIPKKLTEEEIDRLQDHLGVEHRRPKPVLVR